MKTVSAHLPVRVVLPGQRHAIAERGRLCAGRRCRSCCSTLGFCGLQNHVAEVREEVRAAAEQGAGSAGISNTRGSEPYQTQPNVVRYIAATVMGNAALSAEATELLRV